VLLGIAAAWAGARFGRVTLSGHASAYLVGAALAGGQVSAFVEALTGAAPRGSTWVGLPLVVTVAALLALSLRVAAAEAVWGRFNRLPELLLAALVAVGVVGAATAGLGQLGALLLGASLTPGPLAALRTGALAAAAPLCALLAHASRFEAARWLVYPLLLLGGVKLVAEDFRRGSALTLFVSLVLYGGGMSLAARLLRRRQTGALPGPETRDRQVTK
jgi:hypothetical protein